MIPQRPLGSAGFSVSCLGWGTVKLGRNVGVKYPAAFDLPDDRTAAALLDTARACGITLLDTAPAYGTSEQRLGRLIAGQRDAWILSTKVGEEFDGESSRFDFSPDHCRASVERSLRRLGTDWLDIVMIHSDGRDREILESSGAWDCLNAMKAAGQIRAIGMSTKTVDGGCLALENGADVVMATFNPWNIAERPVLDRAAALGRAVIVKKAFASGHFGGSAAPSPLTAADALRFILNHPGVASVVVGTATPAHLRANADAVTLAD